MDTTEEIEALKSELAALRALVESTPEMQAKLAEQRTMARRLRRMEIGRMDPADALAELAAMAPGDQAATLDQIGATSTARILAGADRAAQVRMLAHTSRAVRDVARSLLLPESEVPRTLFITSRYLLGGFETSLPVPLAVATRLVEARIGSFDPNNRKRYLAPTLGVDLSVRWPTWAYEALAKYWPALSDGSVSARPATIDEDRAVIASGK